MARNVKERMKLIFDKIINSVTAEDDALRIAETERHIKGRGNENIIINFVKSAVVKKNLLTSIDSCLFVYNDEKYLLVPPKFSSALHEIGFDEYTVTEDNSRNELEIIQGCEMLAITEGIIKINPKYDSIQIIDECLGLEGESGSITFDFEDLKAFLQIVLFLPSMKAVFLCNILRIIFALLDIVSVIAVSTPRQLRRI